MEELGNVCNIYVCNVISNFRVAQTLDLKLLARIGINSYYDAVKNNVRMESLEPKFFATIWQSGKIVCSGAEDLDQAYDNARYVTTLLKNLGFEAKLKSYKVINIMASMQMPIHVNLYDFQKRVSGTLYNPDLHPGATLNMPEFQACFKIFSTGKVTLMTTTMEFLQQASDQFMELIHQFQTRQV